MSVQLPAVRFSTLYARNRHLLIMTLAIVVVAGLASLFSLPRIEDPRITNRNASIITPMPGATAGRVEALITKPLEDELRELAEIKNIESTSRAGISFLSVELQDWVGRGENELVFSKIRDRLADASAGMPAAAGAPQLDDMRGAVAYSLILSLGWNRSDDPQMGYLTRLAEDLADRFRNLAGSEQVVLFGAVDEEIRISVDPLDLAALGMSASDLAKVVGAADAKAPAGTIYGTGSNLAMEVTGELDSVARVTQVPVVSDGHGAMVMLGDIARVEKRWRDPADQIAYHAGERVVMVAIRTEEGVRLDRWMDAAETTLSAFATEIDDGVKLSRVFDQSRYTNERLAALSGNLLLGAVVVMLVVFFTMGWRSSLIVGAALPLSAGLSLFGLTLAGQQIHQMSIFGMIIAIGLLIDNAIVMTDRVRESIAAGKGRIVAVAEAIQHLATPLFASTFTTILGFMPVFLLPGNVGDFVSPIAIAVILALISSFLLSMTIVPALAALLVKANSGQHNRWWHHGLSIAPLSVGFQRLLVTAMRLPWLSLPILLALPLAGLLLAGSLGMQFFPPAERDQLEVQVWMPGTTSLHATSRQVRAMESAMLAYPAVEHVTWVVGASSPPVYYNQLRTQDSNPAYARALVKLQDAESSREMEQRLQQELAERFPSAQIVARAFGQGPPITAPVALRIVGPELDRLRRYGEQIRTLLYQQPEVIATRASIAGGEPKLWLKVDEAQARLVGLSLSEIADQFRSALDGVVSGQVLEDLEPLPVRIRYGDSDRNALERVAALRLRAPNSTGWIPAEAVAELQLKPELPSITRRNGERVNTIHGYLRQGVLPIEVTRRLQQQLAAGAVEFAPGYRLEIGGDSAEQRRAVEQLLTYAPLLGLLMVTTLVLTFRSFALAGLVSLVALLSVGLGMLSLWGVGYPLGFNPLIGSAGLIGVAINGSIVVLAALRADPASLSGDTGAIASTTLAATRHIVSTTLTTVAGFMPLLLSGGAFWPPLAIVIAGGVGLSIILSLLFTPVMFRLLILRRREKIATESLQSGMKEAGAMNG